MKPLMTTLLVGQLLLCMGVARADLIASWHFDESSGSTAFAAVGSVNGTLTGDASFITGGISGGAASMSKTGGGFIDMGDNFDLNGSSSFSIVAWVRLANEDTDGHIIAGRTQRSFATGYYLAINDVDSGSGEVDGGGMFYQAYPNAVSSDLGLNDGQWHQLVGVHDFAADEAYLYVDGILRGTEDFDSVPSVAAKFAVGAILNTAGTQMDSTLTGDVDEIALWDHALSSTEVVNLFNNPGAAAVPEPSSIVLLSSLSFAGIALRRRRRGSTAA